LLVAGLALVNASIKANKLDLSASSENDFATDGGVNNASLVSTVLHLTRFLHF
jgi:hypothetical protein